MIAGSIHSQSFTTIFRLMLATASALTLTQPASAQEAPLQPGEAYVTRFSGTVTAPGGPVINRAGTVGGIIDLRNPGRPPLGQHWVDAPKRNLVTAEQIGQVFGVTLDDANPPNVYLAATSAFGLHRTANNAQWMPGMWGQGGGPGTIYRLQAAAGSTATIFSQVALNGRPNTGPGLGNIAYDRYNKQLFVSDLETGMIHRIALADGSDLGAYDHGLQGRANFLDVEMSAPASLAPIGFDPNSRARINDCPSRFDRTTECWNFAPSGRRVWGLGVYRNPALNEVRLYYSTWHSPAFGQAGWNNAAEDDKRNAVWSLRLGPDGNFAGDVRREFIVPDFFANPQDIARAGYSQPVSDISFSMCGPRPIMLIAERGGIRNLGLAAENPFAFPHEARTLRYELDEKGAWHAVGRYDIGFYDRSKDGAPFLYANCSGGAAFGFGYNNNQQADPSKPDQFVWMTGDSLCSPEGPCVLPGQAGASGSSEPTTVGTESPLDDSQVHGVQGMAENAFEEIHPQTEKTPPTQQESAGSPGLIQSYLVDSDIVVNTEGQLIEAELARNDATKIGDVAIYVVCEGPANYAGYYLIPGEGPPIGYHYRYGSHSQYWSHNRFRSHNQYWSHNRYESHTRWISHWRYASHNRQLSHRRTASHDRYRSHWRIASHDRRASHARVGSHDLRVSHARTGSHNRLQSANQTHSRAQSANQTHSKAQSANLTRVHSTTLSASQTRVRSKAKTNQPIVHSTTLSASQTRVRSNVKTNQPGVHSTALSASKTRTLNKTQIKGRSGVHSTAASQSAPR
jgi:hypothetical protein